MPTPAQVSAAVDTYVQALASRDRDAWLAAFSADAVLVDPVPSAPVSGGDGLGRFFDGLMAMADRVTVRPRQVLVCGAEAAVVFTTVAGPDAGGGVAFDGVLLVTVDDDGKLSEVRSYWQPDAIRQAGADDEPAGGARPA